MLLPGGGSIGGGRIDPAPGSGIAGGGSMPPAPMGGGPANQHNMQINTHANAGSIVCTQRQGWQDMQTRAVVTNRLSSFLQHTVQYNHTEPHKHAIVFTPTRHIELQNSSDCSPGGGGSMPGGGIPNPGGGPGGGGSMTTAGGGPGGGGNTGRLLLSAGTGRGPGGGGPGGGGSIGSPAATMTTKARRDAAGTREKRGVSCSTVCPQLQTDTARQMHHHTP